MSLLQKTPLYDWHKQKAKLVPFAGFEMPLSYSSIKEEHEAVRKNVGLFDISHMACFYLKGPDSTQVLEILTPRKVSPLKINKMQYNVLLTIDGGIADDVTIFRLGFEDYLIIANCINREKIRKLLSKEILGKNVDLYEERNYILLALQGPGSQKIFEKILFSVNDLFFYEGKKVGSILTLRSGYTGEDGFEILAPIADGKVLWQEFLEKGAIPCGLAARDLLRLEAFYPLYGNELCESLTCASCNLGHLIDVEKDYYGKLRILQEKENPPYETLGFFLQEEGVPRQGFAIYQKDEKVGEVTSGSYSFLWNIGFGLMRIKSGVDKESLWVDIRSQKKKILSLTKSPLKGSIRRRKNYG